MALFQPTNVIPSVLTGREYGTVDATQDITVSWQVNGNSPMVAYQVKIMQNDTDSTLKFDSTKITLATPFFGTNSLGNPKPFSMIITAAQLSTAGIVNGYANGYKMTIKQWWSANDAVEQTSASYFITRSEPELTMGIIPSRDSFLYQQYTFHAIYYQAQNDPIEWMQWELEVNVDGNYVSVDNTGPIFNPETKPDTIYTNKSAIFYYYNGFIIGKNGTYDTTGTKYRLNCTIQTVNGVYKNTGWEELTTVNIGTADPGLYLRLCAMKDTDAVKIEMPKNYPVFGVSSGAYSYEQIESGRYKLQLLSGSSVTWGGQENSLSISENPYSITIQFEINDSTIPCEYFTANYGDKELKLSYNANGFYANFNGETIWSSADILPTTSGIFTISITNTNVFIANKYGIEDAIISSNISEWESGTIQSISIYGYNKFRYIWIDNRNVSYNYFASSLSTNEDFASYTVSTLFLCEFNQSLSSGSNMSARPSIASFSVYRKEIGENVFKHIINLPYEQNAVFYDYSALSQKTYEYFFLNMDQYYRVVTRNQISTITPCFWNYTVLCCEQNMTGDYIVKKEYRFALDVASGSVGNNNSPTIFKNFTQYPLRQPVTDNYRSGTLSAFIGKVENDQYVDSVNLMDELYALSTSKMTKFLKTRKGQIFQIETSAPVSQQIGDKYVVQPSKISLPWVEVGDASKANILGESAIASGVPTFSVSPATMELQMEYAENSQMGADSFSLVDGDLYLNDPGIFQAEDFSLNSDSEVILNTD